MTREGVDRRLAAILAAAAVAYVVLHQRAPDEPPTKIQSNAHVAAAVNAEAV